jgi:hypothetical protein
MAWWLAGRYFESCSCDAVCPCTWSALTAKATLDRCRALLAYHVESGEVDGGHHVRIGDAIDVAVEDFVAIEGHDPVRLTNVFHPSNTTLTVAPARTAHLSTFGIDWGRGAERLLRAVLMVRVSWSR